MIHGCAGVASTVLLSAVSADVKSQIPINIHDIGFLSNLIQIKQLLIKQII